MTLNERHYTATVLRGQITRDTKLKHFFTKLNEEITEMILEAQSYKRKEKNNFQMEVMDCIKVLENMLMHEGIDIEKLREKNTVYQETRKD